NEDLKSVMTSENVEEIKSKMEELTNELNKMSEKLYADTGQQGQAGPQQEAEEDVVDADYEVVDEDEEDK
ncbi:hypothetical protein, partial [Rhodovulum adriaticum]|uniref:hypothetical protein n=1 Tax=Rhodovulum adriaticum TaxID=35804 RepID=UPI001F5B868F